MLRFALLIAIGSVVLTACNPPEKPGIPDELRSELEGIRGKLDALDPKIGDARSIEHARRQLREAKLELGGSIQANGSIWGSDCETECWADWWLCMAESDTEGGLTPFSGAVPEGGEEQGGTGGEASEAMAGSGSLGHTPDDWDEFCDFKHDRCLARCQINTVLKD